MHRLRRRIGSMGLDSPVAGGRERSHGAYPAPHLGFSGATRPRTAYFLGLPAPDPGYFSLAGKVPKRAPKPRFWNPLSNRTLSNLDGALPLNQRILRGSDLWRVSCPASAIALLKRQIHLLISHDTKCLASRGPYPSGHRPGEVSSPPDRLRGASGKKEFQWQRAI